MKDYLRVGFFVLVSLVIGGCRSNNPPPSVPTAERLTIKSVCEEILATPEENINIGKYVVLLTKAIEPDINIDIELRRFNNMADTVRPRIKGVNDAQKIVDILNEYLFREMKFKKAEVPDVRHLETDHFLVSSVLGKKEGTCVSLSVIYLCLAERLNLPIFGVAIPKHFFVRYDDGKTRINIDSILQGENIPDKSYLEQFAPLIPNDGTAQRNRLLVNLSRKEVLANYLGDCILDKFTKNIDVYRNYAIECLNYAIKLSPDTYFYYSRKGEVLWVSNDNDDDSRNREALQCLLKAYELYPYDIAAMTYIAINYYFANRYEDCLKMIGELYLKFTPIDVAKRFQPEMNDKLSTIKAECLKKLGKK